MLILDVQFLPTYYLQQQNVLTLGLMDFLVLDTVKDGTTQTFLSLTSPHSLVVIVSILSLH